MTWLAPRRIATVLLTAVVLALVGTLLMPRALGWSPYVVTSGSMEPAIRTGSVVLTKVVTAERLTPGTVITYRTATDVSTHRIVEREISDSGHIELITQGDANEDPDVNPVDSRNVLGEVRVAVPYVGYLMAAVRTPVGLLSLLGLLAIALWPRRAAEPSLVQRPEKNRT